MPLSFKNAPIIGRGKKIRSGFRVATIRTEKFFMFAEQLSGHEYLRIAIKDARPSKEGDYDVILTLDSHYPVKDIGRMNEDGSLFIPFVEELEEMEEYQEKFNKEKIEKLSKFKWK